MSAGDGMEQITGLPYKLTHDKLMIGSDDRQSLVTVHHAEGVHAVICYIRDGFEEGQWWIEDKSQSGLLLNCERLVGKARLSNGDSIVVAGANILYSNGWLREDHRLAKGVRVDVRELCDARKGYTILRSVSFTGNEGEFVGILGPSGCGKSSVIQRLAGLARYASGSIAVNGHPVGHPIADYNKLLRWLMTYLPQRVESSLRQLIAYLPQNVDDSLHNGLTPLEEMACARRIYLAPSEDDDELDEAILGELGLSDEANRPIGKLSGGQKRRVAIALALLRQPQLLLLDEPTAGLDPATETEVMDCLHRLARQGRTVICATHVMANVSLFDKVLVMSGGEQDHGSPVYFGSPDNLLAHFGVDSYPALYARLKDGSCGTMPHPDDGLDCEMWGLPEPPTRASFWRSVSGYLKRSLLEFCSTFRYPSSKLGYVFPTPIRTLLVQPILIALGMKCACAKMFGQGSTEHGGGVSTVLFCAALSVFWLGLVGSVQMLVRERIPGRCLERLGGVSLNRYGIARLIALLCPCVIQTVTFAAFLFYVPILLPATCLIEFSWRIVGSLLLVYLMGGFVGICVSAFAGNQTWAIRAVPVIAVLALFFSQPVIGFNLPKLPALNEDGTVKKVEVTDDKKETKNDGVAEQISKWWMPCYRPQVYMMFSSEDQYTLSFKEKPDAEEKWLAARKKWLAARKKWVNVRQQESMSLFLLLFALYILVPGCFAWVGQWWREQNWEGR